MPSKPSPPQLTAPSTKLIVILLAEVGDEILAFHPPKRVLQLHGMNAEVMLGIEPRRGHRGLKVKAEPLLNAAHAGTLCQIHEQDEIKHDGRGKNGVAAEKIHLDLHRVAEPAENVDVIPAFFVVAAGRVVVYDHLMIHLAGNLQL